MMSMPQNAEQDRRRLDSAQSHHRSASNHGQALPSPNATSYNQGQHTGWHPPYTGQTADGLWPNPQLVQALASGYQLWPGKTAQEQISNGFTSGRTMYDTPATYHTQPSKRDSAYVGVQTLGHVAQPRYTAPVEPKLTQSHEGVQMVTLQDPVTRVTTQMGVGPAERITDPALYQDGIVARRALYATPGEEEKLYSNYKIRRHDFFKFGRVFLVLWSEPAGEAATQLTQVNSVVANDRQSSGMSVGRMGEMVFSKVRRFVVIREGENYCSALPIVSYGNQGVGKKNVVKSEHGLIYTGIEVPVPLTCELPSRGEKGLRSRPIRVVTDEPGNKLDPMSRIDFAKVHTIHHNLKVAPYGNVHASSREALSSQFSSVWLRQDEDPSGMSRST
jgi:hypothetical protein